MDSWVLNVCVQLCVAVVRVRVGGKTGIQDSLTTCWVCLFWGQTCNEVSAVQNILVPQTVLNLLRSPCVAPYIPGLQMFCTSSLSSIVFPQFNSSQVCVPVIQEQNSRPSNPFTICCVLCLSESRGGATGHPPTHTPHPGLTGSKGKDSSQQHYRTER